MIDHPARARVAEIIVARLRGTGEEYTRGSGYLVSPGWVLTAHHVVKDAASVGVWLGAPPELVLGEGIGVDPRRVLAAPAADLALLPVGGPADDPPCEPALLGRLDREPGPPVPAAAAGCPRSKLRPAPDRPGVLLRELDYAIGSIAALSDAKTGRYEFAVDVAPPPDPEPDNHSPWEGMSGSAVWASNRLIGVVGQHYPQESLATLTVCPVDQLFGSVSEEQLATWRAPLPHLPAAADNLWPATPPTTRKIEVARARRAAEASAPRVLIGRSIELAELEAFTSSDVRWRWIQGDAFAGKTALMASFTLHPPEHVDVAACFLRRANGEHTAGYALDMLTRQLAQLADRHGCLPPPSVRGLADDFADLLEDAARACAERGRRLVVLIDGLDEYDPTTGSLDLADWLPGHWTLPEQAKLLAASRAGAEVRLPPAHPLSGFVQRISASEAATGIQHAARRELDRAVEAPRGFLFPLLCCLAVAGSGLTASEIRALLKRRGRDADVSEIEAELSSYLSRSLVRLPYPEGIGTHVYAFAHDTLLAEARSRFASDLETYEGLFDAWASDYADDNWPHDTPQYLTAPYSRELTRRARDTAALDPRGTTAMSAALGRLTALARSPSRHAFLLRATGSDYAALTEIKNAQDLAVTQEVPDLQALIELHIYRNMLATRTNAIPVTLPAVLARLGHFERAEALARSITKPGVQDQALIELIIATARANAVDRAKALASVLPSPVSRAKATALLAITVVMADDFDRAARLAQDADALTSSITHPLIKARVCNQLALIFGLTGNRHRASHLIKDSAALTSAITVSGVRDRVNAELVGVIGVLGDLDSAEALARSIEGPGFRSWALGRLAAVMALTGDRDRAAYLADEAEAIVHTISYYDSLKAQMEMGLSASRYGDLDLAELDANFIAGPNSRAEILAGLAAIAAAADDRERVMRLASDSETLARTEPVMVNATAGIQFRVLAFLVLIVGSAGDQNHAMLLADDTEAMVRSITDLRTQADSLVRIATAAVNIGDRDRAFRLIGEAETKARTIDHAQIGIDLLAGLATAAAEAGDPDTAIRLSGAVERLLPGAGEGWAIRELSITVAKAGNLDRAEALARASGGLDELAVATACAGDRDRALRMLDGAEAQARTDTAFSIQVIKRLAMTAVGIGDRDRAVRLLNEAEAQIRAITAFSSQVIIDLAELATAAVRAGDRDRAVRLVNEAEAQIRTITDDQYGAFPRLVAAIVEVGDPDRAENLARSIPDNARTITGSSSQAEALVSVVGAIAKAGDLDRAEDLARTIAQTTTDPTGRTVIFEDLTAAIAETGDLDRAEALARIVPDVGAQAGELANLATTAVGAGDRDRALRLLGDAEALAQMISHPARKESVLAEVAVAIAKAGDLDRAEALARSITDAHTQAGELANLATTAVGAGDRDRALRLLGDAEALAQMISHPARKESVLAEVAVAIAKAGDLDRAEALARSITDAHTQADTLSKLATLAQEGDPSRARRLMALALTTGELVRPGWLIKEAGHLYPQVIRSIGNMLFNLYRAD